MIAVAISILILSFLVLIHELGHFFVAKKSGVLIEEFGIGLPPRLWGKKIGETIYSVNALPLGGFVRLHGEQGEIPKTEKEDENKNRGLYAQKPLKRILILGAGITLNFLLGFVIIWGLFIAGHDIAVTDNNTNVTDRRVVIISIAKQSPAETGGLLPNDIVKNVTNEAQKIIIQTTDQFTNLMKEWSGAELRIAIERQNKPMTITVTPRPNPPEGQGQLGVGLMEIGRVQYGFFKAGWEAFKASCRTSIYMFQAIGSLFKRLFTSGDLTGFSGPVGIVKYASTAVGTSVSAVLNLMAMISLNLAVFNLFPLPALDGGRIAFAVWEAITKKPISQKIEGIIHTIGFGLLILLLIVITVVDIKKII